MPAATIMFLDIVGFSKNPNSRQRELVDSLTIEVTSGLSTLMSPPLETHIVAMPTGDGMALAFLHKPNQPWDISTIMSLIHRVGEWAKLRDISLRTGIHTGEVEFITDINNKTNIVGDTINYAQRVMDAANPKQVLFSDVAFRQYIGSNSPSYSASPYSSCKAFFKGPFDVLSKHGMRMLVYKMTLAPPQDWLSNEGPVALDTTVVRLWKKYKWFMGVTAVAAAIITWIVIAWPNQPTATSNATSIEIQPGNGGELVTQAVPIEATPKNTSSGTLPVLPREIDLSYDDGKSDNLISAGGGGYLVSFSPLSMPFVVQKIRVYGMRRISAKTEFQVQIWDSEQKVIFSAIRPVTLFPSMPSANSTWIELVVPDVEVKSDFFVYLYTGNFKDDGIALGSDNSII